MPRRARIIIIVLLVAVAAAAFVLRVHEDLHDYQVDHRAGQRLLAGEDLYRSTDGHYTYKYLPGAAFLEMPLSLLPWPVAKIVFYGLSVIVLFTVLGLSYRLLPDSAPKPRWLMPVTFLVLAKYLAREIDLGQINIFITLLMLLMLAKLLDAERTGSARAESTAGVLWGLASTLKPHGLIFLPYFVLTRRWRALGAGLATLSATAAMPSLFYGIGGNIEQHRLWAESLLRSDRAQLLNPNNTSLLGFFNRTTGDPYLSLWMYGVAVAVLMVVMFIVVRRGRGRRGSAILDVAALMILAPLLSPLGWDYVLLMSVLAVMLQMQHRRALGQVTRWLMTANLVIIGVFITDVVGHATHEFYTDWTLTTINFLVVFAVLVALRQNRAC